MTSLWRWIACLALSTICLSACQQPALEEAATPVASRQASSPVVINPAETGLNWPEDSDCRSLLVMLQRGLASGAIVDLDETPFVLIDNGWISGGKRRLIPQKVANTGMVIPSAEARCVIRTGSPVEHRSDHRVLGREQIRSRYQSGTRREKNPAYDVAKARLRQAERAAKRKKSSIVKVGDPLLDLVGLLVGGAIKGLGQVGKGDQLEEALETLAATPPSIEHPVYKSYHFEQSRVRASREAIVPINLTDRRLHQSWQTSLKRSEIRDLVVLTGLDRQDEDYARHRQNSLTEDSLHQWLAEPPIPPLNDIVAGLLDRSSASPIDRLALLGPKGRLSDTAPLLGDQSIDAAALPTAGPIDAGAEPSGAREPGRIRLIGETSTVEGVFIAPHLILTPSEVIGTRGLVDIEDRPGHVALGLVAAVDHGLGLALVQAPHAGKPVEFKAGVSLEMAAGSTSDDGSSRPLFIGGSLVGFSVAKEPIIGGDAIETFLDRQRHLLPTDH